MTEGNGTVKCKRPRAVSSGKVLALSAVLCLRAVPSMAQDGDWTFEIAPYLWASGISGTVATVPGLPPANADLSFGDIFDNLKFAAMIAGSATKDRFGFMGDLQYVSLGSDAATPGPAFSGASVDAKMLVLSLGAEWVAVRDPQSELRLVAGLRRWQVDTDIAFSAGLLPAQGTSASDNWVDGFVGMRGKYDLSDRAHLTGWALVGAGGSDLMADVMAGVGYDMSDRTTLVAGYRYISVDRVDGAFIYDVEQEGLMLGLKLVFP